MVPTLPSREPGQASCPNLESRLYNLTTATDPATYATDNGLYFADGKVRAVVELQNADTVLPSGYNAVTETRNGALVQALVPVAELCRLSNESQVRYVRAPFEPGR